MSTKNLIRELILSVPENFSIDKEEWFDYLLELMTHEDIPILKEYLGLDEVFDDVLDNSGYYREYEEEDDDLDDYGVGC